MRARTERRARLLAEARRDSLVVATLDRGTTSHAMTQNRRGDWDTWCGRTFKGAGMRRVRADGEEVTCHHCRRVLRAAIREEAA